MKNRVTTTRFATILLTCAVGCVQQIRAQDVPAGTEPWRLIRIFIEQTASPAEEVDRTAFAPRLGGRLAGLDPASIAGRWPRYVDVKIDTVVWLEPYLRTIPPDPTEERPGRVDTLRRVAVWASTWISGNYDNSYFFLERDSIWRIVEWIDFPGPAERRAIVEAAAEIDTTRSDYIIRSRNLLNLLQSDRHHRSRFTEMRRDLVEIGRQLSGSEAWSRIDLGSIPIDSIDPYAALDLPPSGPGRLLFRLNPSALNRLFQGGISRIVEVGNSVRFEIERFAGRSAGYLYLPEGKTLPAVDREADFLLVPLESGWWYYKSFLTPDRPADRYFSLPEDLFPNGLPQRGMDGVDHESALIESESEE